ncbi:MAG TPA: transglutaminase domain-containing protein [Aquaticitalea sp.]|nr:transglutaminase domain-containing protein [Aquaticitalea sp.]
MSDFEKFDFQKADRMALACKNDGLVNLPELVHNLTAELSTDVEKFRAIYRWVCGNIANDYRLYEKNMRKRQRFKDDSLKLKAWNDEFRKRSIRTMIEEKRAICTGYAYLVQEMSKLANIRCEVVNGYARTSTINVETLAMPNHSWNAVQLNGEWYLCDPTWASGIPNPNTFVFEFNYNDGFFLPPPELFAVNHYPLDTKWLLIKEGAPSFDDFLEAPIFYGSAYANLVSYSEPKKMHHNLKKHEKVTFKCQLQKPVEAMDVILLLDNGNGSIKIHPENIKIVNNAVSLEYAFERSGFYDVHLMIGPDMISTYTFRVRGEDKNNYPHLPPP